MNGHVTPADHDSLHCKGVDSAEGPHPNHTAEGTPADSAPEYAQDMPELISDDEDDNAPIQTFQTDQEWRQAISSFRVKGALSSRSSPFSPDSVLDFDQASSRTDGGSEGEAHGQAAGDVAARERARRGAPTDKDWLRMMELEEQKKIDQDGKLAAEEISARKAAADAEAQRNLELRAEERRRLRAEQGLDGNSNDVILARCALRPGVAEDAVCEKADDGCSIRGSEKYLKMVCTEGCIIHYHYACWRAFERVHKVQHPDFSWKSKDGVRCFTDGCTGAVKLALELQIDMGTEIFRRELLRLPEEPKRAAPAAPQAEPKKARKQKGAQKAPAADAEEAKAAKADRPTRQALIERAPAVPAPTPKPEVKVEPAPPPALDFPDINFVQKRRDDEDDLERLEKGLKGKKEKKRREKKGKGVVHVLPIVDAGHEEEQHEAADQPHADRSYAEHFGVFATDPPPGPALNSKEFPGLKSTAPAPAPARPSGDNLSAWETILCLKSARSGPHLLIENVDMHSQQSASKPPAAHLEKLLSKYGTLAALVVLPGLAAAAVTFSSADAAEEAFLKLDGSWLEKKKLDLSFLERFPTRDMIKNVAAESGTPALHKRTAAERFEETAAVGASSSREPGRGAGAEVPKPSKNMLTTRGLEKGMALMGLTPAESGKTNKLRIAAREFVPTSVAVSKPAPQTDVPSTDDKQGSRHASLDGAPQAVPMAVSATPSEAGSAEPNIAQQEADLAAILCLHLLGCDESLLAQYNQQQRFGISLDDLADHSARHMHNMGLVLYDVDTHELHGLWRAKRITQSTTAGQVIAFEVLQKFPAISREKYAMFLALEADGSLDHPQLITGDTAQLCIQQFQQAQAPASSPGRAHSASRSIKAAIKAAARPLKPDVPPFEPTASAPSARPGHMPNMNPSASSSTPSAAAAAATTVAPAQPPLEVPPPTPAPAASDPFASFFGQLFPKEAAPAAPAAAQPLPQPAAPAAPAAPIAVQTAAAGSTSSSASVTPRHGNAAAGKDADRAARMAAFYGTAQASPESRAKISHLLQSSAITGRSSRSSLDGSPRQPASESTLAAAAQSLTGAVIQAPKRPEIAQASAEQPAPAPALQMLLQQPKDPPAVASKPPVRLLPLVGRPAYRPPTVAPRPYRPPIAPVALQTPAAPTQPPPQQQQQQAEQQPQPSFSDMLMSTIHQAPPRPPNMPGPAAARPPQPPIPAQRTASEPEPSENMSRSNSEASLSSEVASVGSAARRPNVCPLCQDRNSRYLVRPCRHLGPCSTCVPSEEDTHLYSKCLACEHPTESLFRIFG